MDHGTERAMEESEPGPQKGHGYSPIFRVLELIAISSAIILLAWLAVRLVPAVMERPFALFAGAVIAVAVADVMSGLLHLAGDTWGSEQWPLIGQTVIRTFREHHVDQLAITRHDAIEVNATSAMVTLPMLAFGHWVVTSHPFLATLALWTSVGGLMTNQIHSWAHRPKNAWWIRVLQRTRIVLSPEAHALHHAKPYADHYCITTGWLNGFFAATKFWRGMEWGMTKVTGAVAREEDLKLAAREATVTALDEEPDSDAQGSRALSPSPR